MKNNKKGFALKPFFLYANIQRFILIPQRKNVIKGFRAFTQIPQKCGWMVKGRHPNAVLLYPSSMLPGNAEIRTDQLRGGNSAQANNDLEVRKMKDPVCKECDNSKNCKSNVGFYS